MSSSAASTSAAASAARRSNNSIQPTNDIEDTHLISRIEAAHSNGEFSPSSASSSPAAPFLCPFNAGDSNLLAAMKSQCLCEKVMGKSKLAAHHEHREEIQKRAETHFCRPANCVHKLANENSMEAPISYGNENSQILSHSHLQHHSSDPIADCARGRSKVRFDSSAARSLSNSPMAISRAALYGLGSGVKNSLTGDEEEIHEIHKTPSHSDLSRNNAIHSESVPVSRRDSRSATPTFSESKTDRAVAHESRNNNSSSANASSPQVAPLYSHPHSNSLSPPIHSAAHSPNIISVEPPPLLDYSNYDISQHRQADGTFLDIPAPVRHHDPRLNVYSWNEIRRHNSRYDCWLVSKGRVYDCTAFLPLHPAGPKAIIRHAGMDATVHFDFHSAKAQKIWNSYEIGRLQDYQPPASGCEIM